MPEPTSIALFGLGSTGLAVRYLQRKYRAFKPYVDRFAALVLLGLLWPVISICALLVKLTSRGPAFYSQKRVGQGGRIFTMWKLRTMDEDAEAQTGPVLATGEADDPRATPVGRVLRATHLDELPQLWNVLRGEMSLIGPRPERPYFVAQFSELIPEFNKRLAIKPGITGLAQIRAGYGRSVRDMRRKVRLDLVYLRRMCWWVDFIIAVGTLRKLFPHTVKRKAGGQRA
jgi:lipopolysaccharide/colanic/teichoic acid biosynthesis glycosyltransferase